MELVAVARDAVHIYSYTPGEALSDLEPICSFPKVQTKDGCAWSQDGNLLGLVEKGGVTVYNAADGYATLCQVPPLVGGPVRNFYFSPLGSFLVTFELWVKDAGDNVGVWDTRTGELTWSFLLKKPTESSWPPLKWTQLETHCCRLVSDGVVIMSGKCERGEEQQKLQQAGVISFELAPRGPGASAPHVAIVIGEARGAPARCQIFRLDDLSKPTASKSFYKAPSCSMVWNNTGTGVLVLAKTETDDTGGSYYGSTSVHLMRADGQEDAIVASADDGAMHDVQWNPIQDEFLLLHGSHPCNIGLYGGKKANKTMDFGRGHRNTIKFNPFGRFVVVGGFGQLAGDVDFWDKPNKEKLATIRIECCVMCEWAPDGRHFLSATTHPRMRVDNKIEMFDYMGNHLGKMPFDELMLATWRPRGRGGFEDRPPSPGRNAPSSQPGAGAAKAKAKQAYRPPGARSAGGGGLAEMLRGELGSSAAGDQSTMATKVFGGSSMGMGRVPPGAAPPEAQAAGGASGSGASRNARKKKAKETAQSSSEVQFVPPLRSGAKERAAFPEEAPGDPAEVEKKVRALRKKLRDIDKLKEKSPGELETLQKQKLAGEGELLAQIRALGAEP